MKSILILFMALICFGVVDAQSPAPGKKPQPKAVAASKPSLDETVNWIVEKLNSNSKDNYYEWDVGNFAFSYNTESQAIICRYDYEDYKFSKLKGAYVTEIPVNKISRIDKGTGYLNLYGNDGKSFIQSFRNTRPATNAHPDGTEYVSSILIPFNFENEENLYERLQKAVENVKSYFPKKQETF